MRNQIPAEQITRSVCRLIGAFDDLYAAAFTAPASVNLRFDYTNAAALASSGVEATMPRGTATPKPFKISLAWNS
jgi:hypothetical protein